MSYCGFVYIWYDITNKMFYIGSHLGTLDDGYAGSSLRFNRAYHKRPSDFKRKILEFCYINDKKELHKIEHKWLNMIDDDALGKKYYNLKKVAAGGNCLIAFNDEDMEKYKQKLRLASHRGNKHYRARACVCFGITYNTLNDAIDAIGFNPSRRLNNRSHIDFYYVNQGPTTQSEVDSWNQKLKNNSLKCIELMKIASNKMSREDRVKKALKAAKTRKKRVRIFIKEYPTG